MRPSSIIIRAPTKQRSQDLTVRRLSLVGCGDRHIRAGPSTADRPSLISISELMNPARPILLDLADRPELREVANAWQGRIVAARMPRRMTSVRHSTTARRSGVSNLLRFGFTERAEMLRKLAKVLSERKKELYAWSHHMGATRRDGSIDIDGGTGTLHAFASLSRGLPGGTSSKRDPPSRLATTVISPAPLWLLGVAWSCKSAPSTSRCGGCWRRSPQHSLPGCPRSSSPRTAQAI